MEPEEYALMYETEESHWWYRGMAAITRGVINTCNQRGSPLRILDAGCGTGAGMAWLSKYGQVTGFDVSGQAVRLSRKRGHKRLAIASLMQIPFAKESFDLVTSFDVLYFAGVQDEVALEEFARVLVPGGKIILRVPAFDWLRGIHDTKVSTRHRYTSRELSTKMEKCRLQPVILSYANTILFPFIALKRLFERWLPFQNESDIAISLGFLDRLFEYCLILESHVIPKWPLPFGLSLIAVGQKRES